MLRRLSLCCAILAFPACSSSDEESSASAATPTDDQYRAQAVQGMHDALLADVQLLAAAAKDLQTGAPVPAGTGWDAKLDAASIDAEKKAWVRARSAYEHVEGALAPLFPAIDTSIDARYDDFLTQLGPMGDSYLFDDVGVTGMHAIERIVYADDTPQRVADFEKTLPGYVAQAFPGTQQEASDFKGKLCAKLISDAKDLDDHFTPANLEVAIAFQGLISLMNEQREKVQKASSNEEESRYSQRTMADLRDNLEGTKVVYALFQPWIRSKSNSDPTKDGSAIDAQIVAGFAELETAYAKVAGDSIPQPPATWSAENPSPTDLETPFGQLYKSVLGAVNPNEKGSIVASMNDAATLLGFPEFQEGH
jgi:iron uptake system component EfeO